MGRLGEGISAGWHPDVGKKCDMPVEGIKGRWACIVPNCAECPVRLLSKGQISLPECERRVVGLATLFNINGPRAV